MKVTKSLKELKEENAQTETTEVETVEDMQSLDTVTATTEEVEDEAVNTELDDAESNEVETESWMQTEEANSDDDHKSGFKPNHEAAKTRKRLKAKLNEKDSELESMRAELEQLRSGKVEPQTEALPPRPKREDFDYDDDKYDAAVDEWSDKKIDARFKTNSQKSNEAQQKEAAQQARLKHVETSLNGHYSRVDKLVGTGKVSQDAYDSAETNVRNAMEIMHPQLGDQVTDNLITTLNSIGEGSEKVIYQLGINPSKLLELKNKIASDPSGFTAVAYLGSLQAQISTPTRKRSSAPKPASNVSGEGGASGQAGAMQKLHAKAGKAGDIQTRIRLKRKAKAQGIDTSNW